MMPSIAEDIHATAVQARPAQKEQGAPKRAASFGDTLLTVGLVLYPALAAVGAIAAGLMFTA